MLRIARIDRPRQRWRWWRNLFRPWVASDLDHRSDRLAVLAAMIMLDVRKLWMEIRCSHRCVALRAIAINQYLMHQARQVFSRGLRKLLTQRLDGRIHCASIISHDLQHALAGLQSLFAQLCSDFVGRASAAPASLLSSCHFTNPRFPSLNGGNLRSIVYFRWTANAFRLSSLQVKMPPIGGFK
jgi:hypothetical protein